MRSLRFRISNFSLTLLKAQIGVLLHCFDRVSPPREMVFYYWMIRFLENPHHIENSRLRADGNFFFLFSWPVAVFGYVFLLFFLYAFDCYYTLIANNEERRLDIKKVNSKKLQPGIDRGFE